MPHNIAFVDDEGILLETLELVFMKEPYNVFTFQNPLKALENLEQDEFAVVVSDLMMPVMDGISFLNEVKERCPKAERLMMTGFQNHRKIDGINVPVITKPWDIISFRDFVEDAVGRYEDKKKAKDNIPAEAKRILFIDDDPFINDVAQTVIKFLGYEAVISQNSTSALELLKSQPDGFDLVITDINMPHMNGIELSRELLNIRPDLPVILITGDGGNAHKTLASEVGIREIISKPFTVKELGTAVDQALA